MGKQVIGKRQTLFACLVWMLVQQNIPAFEIQSARIQSKQLIEIVHIGKVEQTTVTAWKIIPNLSIETVQLDSPIIRISTNQPIQLAEHYYLDNNKGKPIFLVPDGILDSLYSNKTLGYELCAESLVFRIFAPRAKWVRLVLFDHYQDEQGQEFLMEKDQQGVWEHRLSWEALNKFYGYRVWGPTGEGEIFDSSLVLADPYSPAVITKNHFTHPGKTAILPAEPFEWHGDSWLNIPWNDLIIYEMHIRDLTAHPSSGISDPGKRGSYLGLIDPEQKGGLPYLKSLGVNAVELLPIQDFGNIEVPYKDESSPVYNTWNPYARNHWGYMTSYFFAPESYYQLGGNMIPDRYNGIDNRQINEFKTIVKSLHQNGIAVLMDVVYNHVSQYDYNPLKHIDKFYYIRLNEDCSFTSISGCGNDLKTERPMVRRLIVDSLIHWMKEYHIDGFRFDLAKMIDWETIDLISEEAQKINPKVIFIAEPWGGGYDPAGFSDHGWASWNDQIRNGIKGQNPSDGLGFIFGKWQGENNQESLKRYVQGSLRQQGGQYVNNSHSVNYLESHDDYTLGDFIRIGLKDVSEMQRISDLDRHVKLTSTQLKLNKLAALFLFSSQGPVMIHSGQEFARSKVIAPTNAPDPAVGKIDHNSYNKDNETNWLNFRQVNINKKLHDYYRQLIQLRLEHEALRRAKPDNFEFITTSDSLFLAFQIKYQDQKYLVLLNGNPKSSQKISLPEGKWRVLADGKQIVSRPKKSLKKTTLTLPASSGMILIQ
jgi:pullulanase